MIKAGANDAAKGKASAPGSPSKRGPPVKVKSQKASVASTAESSRSERSTPSGNESVTSKEEMFEILKEADPDVLSASQQGAISTKASKAAALAKGGDFSFEDEQWEGSTTAKTKTKNKLPNVQAKVTDAPSSGLKEKLKKKRIKVNADGSVCSASIRSSLTSSSKIDASKIDPAMLEAMKKKGGKITAAQLREMGVAVPGARGRAKKEDDSKRSRARSKSRGRAKEQGSSRARSKSRGRAPREGRSKSRGRAPRTDEDAEGDEKRSRGRSKSRPRAGRADDGEKSTRKERTRSKSRPRARRAEEDHEVKHIKEVPVRPKSPEKKAVKGEQEESSEDGSLPPIPMQIVVDPEDCDKIEEENAQPQISGNSDEMYNKIKRAGITQEQFRALAEAGLTIAEG